MEYGQSSSNIDATINLSEEQLKVLEEVKNGKNVICKAVAGAGKTTTLLNCALSLPEKRFLLLTYNRSLRDDVARRVTDIDNIEVRTIHEKAGHVFGMIIDEDRKLYDRVNEEKEWDFVPYYDVLMIDEAQDLTPTYYKFIQLLYNENVQLVIVGDERQAIHGWHESSSDYLTYADKMFDNSKEWVNLILTTSYRLTIETAKFVNNQLFNKNVIQGNGHGPKPDYYIHDYDKESRNIGYKASIHTIIKAVNDALEEGFSHDEIFFLNPHMKIRNNPPFTVALKEINNLNYTILTNDEKKEKSDLILLNKLVAMTYHRSKGSERKCVIVNSVDESYMKYIIRHSRADWFDYPNSLPNALLVAATRAKVKLKMISGCAPLKTINIDTLADDCTIIYTGDMYIERPLSPDPDDESRKISVCDFLRQLTIDDQVELDKYIIVRDSGKKMPEYSKRMPNMIINFGNIYEEVAHIYGIIIPQVVEYMIKGDVNQWNYYGRLKIVSDEKELEPYTANMTISTYYRYSRFITNTRNIIGNKKKTYRNAAQIAVYQHCFMGFWYMARQIKHYKWVNIPFIRELSNNLLTLLLPHMPQSGDKISMCDGTFSLQKDSFSPRDRLGFEEKTPTLNLYSEQEQRDLNVFGRCDFLTEDTVWEFKLCKHLRANSYYQLLYYMAIQNKTRGLLVPLAGGDIQEIILPEENIKKVLSIFIRNHVK